MPDDPAELAAALGHALDDLEALGFVDTALELVAQYPEAARHAADALDDERRLDALGRALRPVWESAL